MPLDMRHATDVDRAPMLDAISRAFLLDPMWSWVFPDETERRAHYPTLWDFFLTSGLRHDTVQVAGASAAVAIWMPPGVPELSPDEEAALEQFFRTRLGDRADVVLAALALIDRAHPAGELHWHLSVVATDPDHRGRRIGVGLLEHHLRTVDAQHMPAYLESSNPANLERYRRLGFEPRDELRLADDGPLVSTMWRAAR